MKPEETLVFLFHINIPSLFPRKKKPPHSEQLCQNANKRLLADGMPPGEGVGVVITEVPEGLFHSSDRARPLLPASA